MLLGAVQNVSFIGGKVVRKYTLEIGNYISLIGVCEMTIEASLIKKLYQFWIMQKVWDVSHLWVVFLSWMHLYIALFSVGNTILVI